MPPLDLSAFKPVPHTGGDATQVAGGFTTIETWGNGLDLTVDTTLPMMTTLPALPTDGLEIVLTDSLSAPTYWWHLRYHAASGKWSFLGGPDMRAEVLTTLSCTQNATWQDLGGPTLTVPVAGVYRVELFAQTAAPGAASGNNNRFFGVSVNGVSPPTTDYQIQAAGYVTGKTTEVREFEKTHAAAAALKVLYQGNASPITNQFTNSRLSLRPVKLG